MRALNLLHLKILDGQTTLPAKDEMSVVEYIYYRIGPKTKSKPRNWFKKSEKKTASKTGKKNEESVTKKVKSRRGRRQKQKQKQQDDEIEDNDDNEESIDDNQRNKNKRETRSNRRQRRQMEKEGKELLQKCMKQISKLTSMADTNFAVNEDPFGKKHLNGINILNTNIKHLEREHHDKYNELINDQEAIRKLVKIQRFINMSDSITLPKDFFNCHWTKTKDPPKPPQPSQPSGSQASNDKEEEDNHRQLNQDEDERDQEEEKKYVYR